MQININNTNIDVIIERKKIKNMYIRVKNDLNLHVTANRFVSENEIIKTIKDNQVSIYKMYSKMSHKNKTGIFNCLGSEYQIMYNDNIKNTYKDDSNIYTKDDKQLEKYYLYQCKELLTNRFNKYYELMDSLPNCQLRFRKMTSRWGVNNVRKKIITLNTELYKYDISLIDYVIIHELCHFKEANHSRKFWLEVEKYYPNYKMARKQLKD